MDIRRKQIQQVIAPHVDTLSYDIDVIMDRVMYLVSDRTYLNATDLAKYLKRNDVTVRTWARRGSHDFPPPAGYLNGGRIPYWDELDIQVWAQQHSELIGEA